MCYNLKMIKTGLRAFIISAVILSLLNISLWYFFSPKAIFEGNSDSKKIQKITDFLDEISPTFTQDLKTIVKNNNAPSWGCGPVSYALAKIINKKFFNDELIIDALYDNDHYEIVQRFGFVKFQSGSEEITGDHAWLEIYLGDKMIYVDPTIAQYGRSNGLAYEVTPVGAPQFKEMLKEKYGILDARLSIMLRKVSNKIPTNEMPYPGITIDAQDLDYFKGVLALRNTVSLGKEPSEWLPWVNYFITKY